MRDDRAQVEPLILLLIAVGTLAFQSLIFGGDLMEKSVITQLPNETSCQYPNKPWWDLFGNVEGAVGFIGCLIRIVVVVFINVILMLSSVVLFFFNAVTFNVPGAPGVIRVIFGTIFIGGMGWAIAGLFRGAKA